MELFDYTAKPVPRREGDRLASSNFVLSSAEEAREYSPRAEDTFADAAHPNKGGDSP
jgi:hypothetical protein